MNREKLAFMLVSFMMFNGFLTRNEIKSKYISNGNRYYKNKEYEAAVKEYINAEKFGNKNETLNFNIGNSYYKMKKYREAASYYEKGDKSSDNFFNLGNAYYKIGETASNGEKEGLFQKALESYKKAMTKLASLPNVYCKISGFPTDNKLFVKNLIEKLFFFLKLFPNHQTVG